MKYTPGPWKISSSFLICNEKAQIITNCSPLTEIPELCIPLDQSFNNAQLIAAAPEMLEALKNILTQYGNVRAAEGYPNGDSITMKRARAAIAKAEGKQ